MRQLLHHRRLLSSSCGHPALVFMVTIEKKGQVALRLFFLYSSSLYLTLFFLRIGIGGWRKKVFSCSFVSYLFESVAVFVSFGSHCATHRKANNTQGLFCIEHKDHTMEIYGTN